MKKILVLALLISLGLNIGLGVRLRNGTVKLPRSDQGWEHTRGSGHSGHTGQSGSGGRGSSGGGRGNEFWLEVMERRLVLVSEQLGLTDEQSEAFQKTHREASVGFFDQRVKVQEARQHLMEAASAPGFGVDTLRHLIADVGRQQVKLDSLVTETMLQEMEILDEDQRRQYIQILPVNRFGGRSGRGGPDSENGGRRHRR